MKNRAYNINHEDNFNAKVEMLKKFNRDFGTNYILRNGRVTRMSDDGHTHDVWAELPEEPEVAYKVEYNNGERDCCDVVKSIDGAMSLARYALRFCVSVTVTEVTQW